MNVLKFSVGGGGALAHIQHTLASFPGPIPSFSMLHAQTH